MLLTLTAYVSRYLTYAVRDWLKVSLLSWLILHWRSLTCMVLLMNRVRFDMSHLPIRDELDFALMQVFQKERVVIECIELSYDALDSLIATDPSRMRCKSANNFKWRAINLKPSDNFTSKGMQYRLITRRIEPSEV